MTAVPGRRRSGRSTTSSSRGPAPRLAEGLAALALAIHPDLALDPAPPTPPAHPVARCHSRAHESPASPRELAAAARARAGMARGAPPSAAAARRRRPRRARRRARRGRRARERVGPIGDTVAILGHSCSAGRPTSTWPASAETIVLELRLPRVLTAMVVGVGLALAGATFQGLLRNPLADPYVLGTASGAALGAAIAVLVPVQVALSRLRPAQRARLHRRAARGGRRLPRCRGRRRSSSLTTVLLTGYAVGSLLAAGLAMAMYLSGRNLRQIFFYLLGSFSPPSGSSRRRPADHRHRERSSSCSRARSLNALLLGEETARHLGIDVRRERRDPARRWRRWSRPPRWR